MLNDTKAERYLGVGLCYREVGLVEKPRGLRRNEESGCQASEE